jgi:hypothetical protein
MKKEYGNGEKDRTCGKWVGKTLRISVCAVISVFSLFSLPVFSQSQTTDKRLERERERAYVREQFKKNFRDLQLLGKGLLQDHEEIRLTPGKLAKSARAINKCARALRALIALGEMASETPIKKEIATAREFDESIRKLATLISDFAHNPVHQSNKVFNTDEAERAQTDLLTVINLSKALENKSKRYSNTRLLSDK